MAGQGKALVLLVTDHALQLLLWLRGSLTVLGVLHNNNEGQENLLLAIREYPDYPVLVVADLIDESFRHDHIVHVTGTDREALIKRKLDFAFRNTPYRIGRVNGREREGRRLDKLMMAAINKPDALDSWMRLLLDEKRAIQSVTSMSWLLREYVILQKLDKEQTLLLVNLEPGNTLRQSFFQSGTLLFSRLTHLNMRSDHDLENEIYLETLQVRQYLERIQFVEYEAPLLIHVLTVMPAQELDLSERSSGINRFEVIECDHLLAAVDSEFDEAPAGPTHALLAQILARKRPGNVYGSRDVTRYHDLLRLGTHIAVAAALVLCATLVANLPRALEVLNKWDQAEIFAARTLPLQQQYSRLSENFPETPIPSSEMALIVEAYDRLQLATFFPHETMNLISAALARTEGVVLTSIHWQLEEAPDPGAAPLPGALSGTTADTAFTGLILQGRTRLKVMLNGQAYSPNSFREAQDQVQALIAALAANPGLSVFASRMPTDVRTDIAVTTTVDDGEVRAPFTLELILTDAVSQVAVSP